MVWIIRASFNERVSFNQLVQFEWLKLRGKIPMQIKCKRYILKGIINDYSTVIIRICLSRCLIRSCSLISNITCKCLDFFTLSTKKILLKYLYNCKFWYLIESVIHFKCSSLFYSRLHSHWAICMYHKWQMCSKSFWKMGKRNLLNTIQQPPFG